jgi:hypothetical protein
MSAKTRFTSFHLWLTAIFILGTSLRLYLLPSQILVDDEWHNLNQVIGKSYWDLLTQFNPVDNSSLPMNLYDLALLKTIGWSEMMIRLPVILTGLASLIVLPLLVRKVFNARVGVIFGCLLAISPFLIFYSRFVRAYGFFSSFCFAGLLLSYLWLSTGKPRYLVAFIFAGAFANCAHLFSMFAVFMPLIIAAILVFTARNKPLSSPERSGIVVSMKQILTTASILGVLLLPVLIPVLREHSNLPWGRGAFTIRAIWTAVTLLSGTPNIGLNFLFYLLVLAGAMLLFKVNRLFFWLSIASAGCYPIVLALSHPTGMDNGEVLLRYMIVVVPLALTFLSLELDSILTKASSQTPPILKWIPTILAPITILMVFFDSGPLPALYQSGSNFAHHGAFQNSYVKQSWQTLESHSVYPDSELKQENIPSFYKWLPAQSNIASVIEYPYDLCDYNNLLYYYQHFHHKRVIAGYYDQTNILGYTLPPLPKDGPTRFGVGKFCTDEILALVSDQSKLTFRNMINVNDDSALLHSEADMLILHKTILVLKIVQTDANAMPVYDRILLSYNSVPVLSERYKKSLGPPVFEDADMVCFNLKK